MFECPYPGCGKTITKPDIETFLNLGMQANLNNKVNLANQFGSCPTPDCPYIYEIPVVGKFNPKFECPVCDGKYCLRCKKDYHVGKNCNSEMI